MSIFGRFADLEVFAPNESGGAGARKPAKKTTFAVSFPAPTPWGSTDDGEGEGVYPPSPLSLRPGYGAAPAACPPRVACSSLALGMFPKPS